MITGLPLGLFSLLLTGIEINRTRKGTPFVGYPLTLNTLCPPIAMAITTLAFHFLDPD